MIRTLQLYVARELLKTFSLTAIGLALTFSLCGGVFNMIEADALTPVQMLKMLMFILPVALTLTLPVAALFACAITYGRFAADNEIDACKASGINIHRLLWPALLLSVGTAAFTFAFTNHILPRFVESLDAMLRKDLEKLMVHALNTRGYVRRGPYVLYARHAAAAGQEGRTRKIDIDHAAFFELEGEQLARCGTAQKVHVDFTTPDGGNPMVQAAMFRVRGLDMGRNQFYEEDYQPFHSMEIPTTLKQKLKWLTLPQLLAYGRDLTELPTVQESLRNIRLQIREAGFYRYVIEQITTGDRVLRLNDGRVEFEVRARQAQQDPNDFRPVLEQVTIREWRLLDRAAGRRSTADRRPDREYTTSRCNIKVKRGIAGTGDTVQLYLPGRTTMHDALDQVRSVEKSDLVLDEVLLDPRLSSSDAGMTDEQILAISDARPTPKLLVRDDFEPLGLSTRIENARAGTRREMAKLALEIDGIVHSRLAFSVSVLVMLVLAAGLGIVFRGGQLLTAFVISFAPALLVVVMNIMGRQLAENLNTAPYGIATIWGGILVLGIADFIVLTWFLRR